MLKNSSIVRGVYSVFLTKLHVQKRLDWPWVRFCCFRSQVGQEYFDVGGNSRPEVMPIALFHEGVSGFVQGGGDGVDVQAADAGAAEKAQNRGKKQYFLRYRPH